MCNNEVSFPKKGFFNFFLSSVAVVAPTYTSRLCRFFYNINITVGIIFAAWQVYTKKTTSRVEWEQIFLQRKYSPRGIIA